MTGSRRPAPLSILLIAAAVLAALIVPGATAQAQAQNERTPPSNLVARLVQGGVELTWDRPAQNDESVDGYEILRRRPNRGEQTLTTLMPDTATTDTAYFDTTATEPGVRYNYRVKAIRNGVTSRPSNTATVLVLLSAPTTRLVSNTSQPESHTATASITQQYAMGFRLGSHGQGYAVSGVSIGLAAVPSGLSVSLWVGGVDGNLDGSGAPQRELFEFDNPGSFRVGLNRFAAPEGAFAYPGVSYFVVLSGFGSSLSVTETTSGDEDPGGEPGAVVLNGARVRDVGSTGQWDSFSARSGALRMVVEGSRRGRGILASALAPAVFDDQEIISTGDDCCFEMRVGPADRYLLRNVSVAADSAGTGYTTTDPDLIALGGVHTGKDSGFPGIPFNFQTASGTTLFTLPVASARGDLTTGPARLTGPPGISEWSFPQGATVAGNATYVFDMTIDSIAGDVQGSSRGGVVLGRVLCAAASNYTDAPSAPGVTFSSHGDVICDTPSMAVDGEPLVAMVSNLDQDNDSYATANSTNSVISQGFSTGPGTYGYRFQGIGVDVEGSEDSNSDPQIPDGPSSVSVAVHAAKSDGKPGDKLFDLVSPDHYAAGQLAFFEAPPGTYLDPDTSYVMVWTKLNGEDHRLDRTASDDQENDDPRRLKGFAVANTFHLGGSLTSLTESTDSHALKIAVYGEAVDTSFLAVPRLESDIEIPDGPRLVSNVGQSASGAIVAQQYAMGFRLGSHGQGYAVSGVSIGLAAVPSGLSVSLWVGGVDGNLDGSGAPQRELFEFDNPGSFRVGLNRFAAPEGAFAYPGVSYFVVLSGFGSSLSVTETTSGDEDPGGEPGAVVLNGARVRDVGSTGQWDSFSARSGALRMVVEGSRRGRGILASALAPAVFDDQEIISTGDDCCFEMRVGPADRYLLRNVSVAADSAGTGYTTTDPDLIALGGVHTGKDSGFPGIPFNFQTASGTTLFTLPVASARGDLTTGPARLTGPPGISEWSFPQGATVAGNATYVFDMTIDSIAGDVQGSSRGGVVLGRVLCAAASNYTDAPSAPGVTFSSHGDVICDTPSMAVDGEPLVAMVSNLDQDNDSYATANSTNSVISQGFSTGPGTYGYRFQGIGVDVEGSEDSNSDPQIPDGPSSVSVAVHAAKSDGKPGDKLFDLVSPDHYAAGQLAFFEAPPGTYLDPDTSYVMVWTKLNGEDHRLDRTASDDQENDDPRRLKGFSLANTFHLGGSLTSLTESTDSHALKIAVYGEAVEGSFVGSARFVSSGYQVTPDWLHTPHDARVGDQFRVVFVTGHAIDATSGDIADYDALVQMEARGESTRPGVAAGYTNEVIQNVASEFKAVVCTAAIDARTHTGMTDALGVPIRWLDGGWEDHPTLIANSYNEFFGPQWQNEEWGAYVTGNSASLYEISSHEANKGDKIRTGIWTGCNSTGTAHQMYFVGSPDGLATLGTPGDVNTSNAPIGPSDSSKGAVAILLSKYRPLYAISPVFTVVPKR
ncbi:choice-of-anchor R domain-containing protein [Candidatus Poriferisodalis sp.]|uniref:choice-of-anchor R domain-containing protein n=1 Tax=Candidatus Poriferisodalis sp. TaxID=3101277 RepID=UPI003AF6B50F